MRRTSANRPPPVQTVVGQLGDVALTLHTPLTPLDRLVHAFKPFDVGATVERFIENSWMPAAVVESHRRQVTFACSPTTAPMAADRYRIFYLDDGHCEVVSGGELRMTSAAYTSCRCCLLLECGCFDRGASCRCCGSTAEQHTPYPLRLLQIGVVLLARVTRFSTSLRHVILMLQTSRSMRLACRLHALVTGGTLEAAASSPLSLPKPATSNSTDAGPPARELLVQSANGPVRLSEDAAKAVRAFLRSELHAARFSLDQRSNQLLLDDWAQAAGSSPEQDWSSIIDSLPAARSGLVLCAFRYYDVMAQRAAIANNPQEQPTATPLVSKRVLILWVPQSCSSDRMTLMPLVDLFDGMYDALVFKEEVHKQDDVESHSMCYSTTRNDLLHQQTLRMLPHSGCY